MNRIKPVAKKWGMVLCGVLLLAVTGCRLPGLPPPPGLPGLPPPPLPPFGLHEHQPSPAPVVATKPVGTKPDNVVQLASRTP